MKTSNRKQQTPRRKYSPERADRLASELCSDMLSFMINRYELADDDERIELIVRYAPAILDLERTLARIARRQRRRQRSYPGDIETKHA